jgi:hypothetical protein
MKISVSEAARQLEDRGALVRQQRDQSERHIEFARTALGREPPEELAQFYRECIASMGDFTAQVPVWNDHVGWRSSPTLVTRLLPADAVPLFDDGCGNLFGLDLTAGIEPRAVYFFDHEQGFERPEWAAGSSVGAFLLLLADHDRAIEEEWPSGWELAIDPNIARCPRAPPIFG